jgi:hypothetical protein
LGGRNCRDHRRRRLLACQQRQGGKQQDGEKPDMGLAVIGGLERGEAISFSSE